MNIGFLQILQSIEDKYQMDFDKSYFDISSNPSEVFDIEKAVKSLKQLQEYLKIRYEIIENRTPLYYDGLIKIIYELSIKICSLENDLACNICINSSKCDRISNSISYCVALFVNCYIGKNNILDELPSPKDAENILIQVIIERKKIAMLN
jgi:hypothetical protein